MKKTATVLKNLWNDESGQGATEYILLLVVVVGLALIFKKQLMEMVSGKLSALGTDIGGFTSTP